MKASVRLKSAAWAALILSTFFGMVSFYWLAFSIWMTAHPLYDSHVWEHRVYVRFAITVADAIVWIASVILLFRLRSSDHKSSETAHR